MKLLKKVLAGSDERKTRFHDESGQQIPLSRALRNGPQALLSGIGRLALGHRSVRPWISYDAQAYLERALTPDSRVLEFGSGMSTVWYARRAGQVVSIEDHKPWFEAVQAIIAREGCQNIDYRFANDLAAYTRLTPGDVEKGFDLIMVDGKERDACVEAALPALRPGGMFYLDNSDRQHGPVPRARKMLLEFAQKHDAEVIRFVDFAPTQLFVQQGLLVRLRG